MVRTRASLFVRSLFVVAAIAASSHSYATGRSVDDPCSASFNGLGHEDLGHVIDPALADAMNKSIPAIEAKAYKAMDKYPGTEGFIRFNEAIDESLRANPEYARDLLKLAENRLPYIHDEPTIVFVSGGVADPWAPVLERAAAEEGMRIRVVKLPGSLSSARGGNQKPVPAFPEELKKQLREHPAIFLDDTYTNGGTASAVREAVRKAGGKLDGVFVAYEGGKGDPASLYKSGRNNRREPSMGNFPESPTGWTCKSGSSCKIAVDESALTYDGKNLTRQGSALLSEFQRMGAEVQFLKNGKPSDAPSLAKAKFPGLKVLSKSDQADVAIGNWGREFRGDRQSKAPSVPSIETVQIGRYRDEGIVSEELLDRHYFLNRLSEMGVLEPRYARPQHAEDTAFAPELLDLRNVAVPRAEKGSRQLAEIFKIAEPKARVAALSNVQWSELTDAEQAMMLGHAPKIANSFEMGQYIRIAGDSHDPRWKPALESWVNAWKGIDRGWQTFLRPEAERALESISKAPRADPYRKIVSELLKQGESSEKPVIYFLAGAPGAGKNTAIDALAKAGEIDKKKFLTLDPDEIRPMLPGHAEAKAADPATADSKFFSASGALRADVLDQAMAMRKNIIHQGTLTPPEKYEDLLASIKKRHPEYEIRIIHVKAPEKELLQRVARRAGETGRQVPDEAILKRVDLAVEAVDRLKDEADEVIEIENDLHPTVVSVRKDGKSVPVYRPLGKEGLEFTIPRAQIEQARRQVDRQFLSETLFIVPHNDGEAVRAVEILRGAGAPHLKVSRQAWGATLDKEPIWPEDLRNVKRVVIFEIPNPQVEEELRRQGLEVDIIDHHFYKMVDRRKPESSLEQLAKMIHWPMSKTDQAIGANDGSYIPGMKKMGLSEEEIRAVRRYDLAGQGKNDFGDLQKREREARELIPHLPMRSGVYVVKDGVTNDGTILKQELAMQAPDGVANTLEPGQNRVGFSGEAAIVEKFLKIDFEALGYPKGSYDQYGGGQPPSLFFGFKPKMPPRGSHELVPQRVMDEFWKIIEEVKGPDTSPKANAAVHWASLTDAEYAKRRPRRDSVKLEELKKAVEGMKDDPKTASAIGVQFVPEVEAAGMMPRGSAVMTSSGDLEKKGIRNIIHAASGGMTRKDGPFAPSLDGVTNSVKNSIALAREGGHRRVAIPFVGGKSFIDEIGIAPQELANRVVDAAIEGRQGMEIRFVTYGDADTRLFQNALARHKDLPAGSVEVKNGSITDFSLHGATAIVNAANMEVKFGGGVSGVIGDATGRKEQIDAEAQKAIRDFYGQSSLP